MSGIKCGQAGSSYDHQARQEELRRRREAQVRAIRSQMRAAATVKRSTAQARTEAVRRIDETPISAVAVAGVARAARAVTALSAAGGVRTLTVESTTTAALVTQAQVAADTARAYTANAVQAVLEPLVRSASPASQAEVDTNAAVAEAESALDAARGYIAPDIAASLALRLKQFAMQGTTPDEVLRLRSDLGDAAAEASSRAWVHVADIAFEIDDLALEIREMAAAVARDTAHEPLLGKIAEYVAALQDIAATAESLQSAKADALSNGLQDAGSLLAIRDQLSVARDRAVRVMDRVLSEGTAKRMAEVLMSAGYDLAVAADGDDNQVLVRTEADPALGIRFTFASNDDGDTLTTEAVRLADGSPGLDAALTSSDREFLTRIQREAHSLIGRELDLAFGELEDGGWPAELPIVEVQGESDRPEHATARTKNSTGKAAQ